MEIAASNATGTASISNSCNLAPFGLREEHRKNEEMKFLYKELAQTVQEKRRAHFTFEGLKKLSPYLMEIFPVALA
jgi:hypothetical protein